MRGPPLYPAFVDKFYSAGTPSSPYIAHLTFSLYTHTIAPTPHPCSTPHTPNLTPTRRPTSRYGFSDIRLSVYMVSGTGFPVQGLRYRVPVQGCRKATHVKTGCEFHLYALHMSAAISVLGPLSAWYVGVCVPRRAQQKPLPSRVGRATFTDYMRVMTHLHPPYNPLGDQL